ncbi:pseudouridine synthase [Endozoicomonadaceae bacterium StTr2]
MQSKRTRLDRFISKKTGISRGALRSLFAKGMVSVDGVVNRDARYVIDEFSKVSFDGEELQNNTPVYIMMHKPAGVVSATKDEQHKTVIDLLERPDKNTLHIAGRLDLHSSGLLLLTNDSRWSSRLTLPEKKVRKVYRVTLANPLTDEYIEAFAKGMYFGFEDITTRPAQLKILSEHVAEVTLEEGRYHQIKRMFGRFRNPVVKLHRLSVGNLVLDDSLPEGQSRELSEYEVSNIS